MKTRSTLMIGVILLAMLGVVSLPNRAKAESLELVAAEAFGAMVAFTLYDAQMIVGITADAYAKDMYTAEQAAQIIAEQKGAMGVVREYVGKLKAAVAGADKDSDVWGKITGCADKLEATIDSLSAYIDSPTQENADAFQEKRQTSYAAIADFMGLENQ